MNPKENALNWIMKNQSRLTEISEKIWKFAEVGLQEYKSSSLLSETLEKEGFTVQRGVAGMPTAFVASYGKGKPVIGVLGEYDALPGLSQKAIPKKEPVTSGAPDHSWQRAAASGMSIGYKSLVFAAKAIAWTALDLIMKPSALKAIREEFMDRPRGVAYTSPLHPDLKPPLHQLPPTPVQKE